MHTDTESCVRAVRAKDARFDGVFLGPCSSCSSPTIREDVAERVVAGRIRPDQQAGPSQPDDCNAAGAAVLAPLHGESRRLRGGAFHLDAAACVRRLDRGLQRSRCVDSDAEVRQRNLWRPGVRIPDEGVGRRVQPELGRCVDGARPHSRRRVERGVRHSLQNAALPGGRESERSSCRYPRSALREWAAPLPAGRSQRRGRTLRRAITHAPAADRRARAHGGIS